MDVEVCRDHLTWNTFIKKNSGPFFDRFEWADLSEVYGHDAYRFVARDSETVHGCLPLVHIDSTIFGEALVSMPYSEHGSLVIDDSSTGAEQATELLYEHARSLADELAVDYLCLRGARQPAPEDYIRFTRYLTFGVSIDKPEDEIWNSFETRFRTNVRSAKEHGFTSRMVQTGSTDFPFEPIEAYYDLHLQTMRELGSPPHSKTFFEKIWRELEDNVLLAFLCQDGTPVNAALVFSSDDVLHYWGAVSDIEHRGLNGGSQLLWECVRWGSENDYDLFDLGRTRPGTGVYRFKSSLNGREIWLDDLYYFPDEFVAPPDPEDSKFELFTRIWRRLPLPLTAYVGPHLRGNIP